MAIEPNEVSLSAERLAAERAVLARRVSRLVGELTTAATQRMDTTLPWFSALPANERASVGTVAQAGINTFVDWFSQQKAEPRHVTAIFSAAPRDLARALSFQHTVELLRTTMDVVEESISTIAGNNPQRQTVLREALLRFSREIAFAAAQVYAEAAEERGAWDARLHDLLFDAIVDNLPADTIAARTRALGWVVSNRVCCLVGPVSTKRQSFDVQMEHIRRLAKHHGLDAIVGMKEKHLIIFLSGIGENVSLATVLEPLLMSFGSGSIVHGPVVSDITSAHTSYTEALSGFRSTNFLKDSERLLNASTLVSARIVSGDHQAANDLINLLKVKLKSDVLETLATYLEKEPTIEGCARLLFVHVNTIRYRLKRVLDVTGYDPADPTDALTLRLAVMVARSQGKL